MPLFLPLDVGFTFVYYAFGSEKGFSLSGHEKMHKTPLGMALAIFTGLMLATCGETFAGSNDSITVESRFNNIFGRQGFHC